MAKASEAVTFPICRKSAINRIALAPMTNTQSHLNGCLSADEHHWLRLRAEGGFGTIITAGAYVDEVGKSWNGQIGIHNSDTAKAFAPLIHDFSLKNTLGVLQLFHGGMRAKHDAASNLSPSGGKNSRGDVIARAMTTNEIRSTIAAHIDAAERAQQIGFTGVEIHAAHGYLIHQFLSTATNHRNDEWGGKTENRNRFLLSILRGIRDRCGDRFLVGVRLSPEDANWFHGIDFDACLDLSCKLAEEESVDYLHISLWDAFKHADKYPNDGPAICHFKQSLPAEVPLMTAGKIWSAEDANTIMGFGADMIALGRVAIAHPTWPRGYAEINNYDPLKPPFTKRYLNDAGLNNDFVTYMTKWKGFVSTVE